MAAPAKTEISLTYATGAMPAMDAASQPGNARTSEALRIFSEWRRVASAGRPEPAPAHVLLGPGSPASLVAMLTPCWGDGHAESPDRLTAALAGLHELWTEGLRWELLPDEPCIVDDATLERVYTPRFLADFARLESGAPLEPRCVSLPNVASAASPGAEFARAARHAAGTVLRLAQLAAAGALARGFAVVRPPGHHCTASASGGNGVLNSVALAAVAVAAAGHRVLVVDLDVHFSGGTVEILRGAPLTAYAPAASGDGGGAAEPAPVPRTYAVDVYGARGQELKARARAQGRRWDVLETTENAACINVALLDSAAGDATYASDAVLGEILRRWDAHAPDVVLVSLGFDALLGDDEGFTLSPGVMGGLVRAMAQRCRADPGAEGPALVVALEGGYKLPAIRAAAASVMRALLERPTRASGLPLRPRAPA